MNSPVESGGLYLTSAISKERQSLIGLDNNNPNLILLFCHDDLGVHYTRRTFQTSMELGNNDL
jgi:hypothetical protein